MVEEKSWEQRNLLAATYIKEVLDVAKTETDDIVAAIEAYFTKMKVTYFYRCNKKFIGNAMLIRAEEQTLINKANYEVKHDYGLSEVTRIVICFNSLIGNLILGGPGQNLCIGVKRQPPIFHHKQLQTNRRNDQRTTLNFFITINFIFTLVLLKVKCYFH